MTNPTASTSFVPSDLIDALFHAVYLDGKSSSIEDAARELLASVGLTKAVALTQQEADEAELDNVSDDIRDAIEVLVATRTITPDATGADMVLVEEWGPEGVKLRTEWVPSDEAPEAVAPEIEHLTDEQLTAIEDEVIAAETVDPVAVDTEISQLDNELETIRLRAEANIDAIHRAVNDVRDTLTGRWNLTHDEAQAKARELAIDTTKGGARYADLLAVAADLTDQYTNALAALKAEQAKYTGWNRFFLVTNTNGHIHRSTSCSTCFSTTRFAWRTELSGKTEAQAVNELGEILCSVCFPSAPVEWTNGISHEAQIAKDGRDAAKAKRAADKAAKALVPGQVGLRLTLEPMVAGRAHTEVIKTIYAAKQWLTNAWDWHLDYVEGHCTREDGTQWHPSYPEAAFYELARVLAERTGEGYDATLRAAVKRAENRRSK